MNTQTYYNKYGRRLTIDNSSSKESVFDFEVPGKGPNDVKLQVSDEYLDIVTTKGTKLATLIAAPERYDFEKITMKIQNGILTGRIPRKTPKTLTIIPS